MPPVCKIREHGKSCSFPGCTFRVLPCCVWTNPEAGKIWPLVVGLVENSGGIDRIFYNRVCRILPVAEAIPGNP